MVYISPIEFLPHTVNYAPPPRHTQTQTSFLTKEAAALHFDVHGHSESKSYQFLAPKIRQTRKKRT